MDENRRTRRRGSVLEGQILEAAWLELGEQGWAGFRMERVATRAGAGKASLYARWPNKAALVRAAATHMAATSRGPAEFTGDLGTGLLAVLRGAAEFHDGAFGEALRGIVAEARTTDTTDLSMFNDEMPVQVVLDLVTDAQQAGRLPAAQVPTRVLNLGLTLVSHYFLLNGLAPTEEDLVDIVDSVWLPLLDGPSRHSQ